MKVETAPDITGLGARNRARKKHLKDFGWLYIVRSVDNTGPVKVGWSSSPSKRLKLMHWGSPVELVFVDLRLTPRKFEGEVHRRLKKHRLRGEWYDLDVDQITSLLKYIHELYPMGWVQSAEQ